MWPELRLTKEELEWSDYYERPGKAPVETVEDRHIITLSQGTPTATGVYRSSRRSRVYGFTWAGDVWGARVRIRRTTDWQLTDEALHIPLLSGHSPHSTLNIAPFIPVYPTAANGSAIQQQSAFVFVAEPNIVLPATVQLVFEYSLENPNDPALSQGASYQFECVVHAWDFPGWRGSPRG
jgi:hypothetical protein